MTLSTYDRLMQNPVFAEKFNAGYTQFLLSELLLAMMEEDTVSVRALAKEVGLSPTAIQNMRSGKQKDVKMINFLHIAKACGYDVILEKGKQRIPLAAGIAG